MFRERGTALRGPQRLSRTSLPLVGNVASEAPLGLLSPPGTGQAPALGRQGAGHNVSIRTTPLTDKKLSPKGQGGTWGDWSPREGRRPEGAWTFRKRSSALGAGHSDTIQGIFSYEPKISTGRKADSNSSIRPLCTPQPRCRQTGGEGGSRCGRGSPSTPGPPLRGCS